MTPENPIVGSITLRRPAIQSPDFVAGVSGWSINADGSAQFNNVILSSAGSNVTVNIEAGTIDWTVTLLGGKVMSQDPLMFVELGPAIGRTADNQFVNVSLSPGFIAGTPSGQAPSIQLNTPSADGTSTDSIALLADQITVLTGLLYAGSAGRPSHPVYGSGWADGPFSGPFTGITYLTDALGNLVIVGAAHTTGPGASSTMFSLAAPHIPVSGYRSPAIVNNGGTLVPAFLEIDTSGAVVIDPVPSAGGDVYVQAVVPLLR